MTGIWRSGERSFYVYFGDGRVDQWFLSFSDSWPRGRPRSNWEDIDDHWS